MLSVRLLQVPGLVSTFDARLVFLVFLVFLIVDAELWVMVRGDFGSEGRGGGER